MDQHPWAKQLGVNIIVCDPGGIVLEMNDMAVKTFEKQGGKSEGGKSLLGKNLFDCHPEPARTKLKNLMENQQTNVYTIERNGIKTLIHQSPWYADGRYAGFVEISFEIPAVMPQFFRPSGSNAE
jgi:hypothetical protein